MPVANRQIPHRWAAKVSTSRRRCGNCKYFDRDGFQAAASANPVFLRVMQAATPDRLGRRIYTPEVLEASRVLDDVNATDEAKEAAQRIVDAAEVKKDHSPTGAQWADYGACPATEQLVWAGHNCEEWA